MRGRCLLDLPCVYEAPCGASCSSLLGLMAACQVYGPVPLVTIDLFYAFLSCPSGGGGGDEGSDLAAEDSSSSAAAQRRSRLLSALPPPPMPNIAGIGGLRCGRKGSCNEREGRVGGAHWPESASGCQDELISDIV